MFILSKIVAFFLKPLNILMATGLYALFAKQERHKKTAFRICIIGLLLATNPWLVQQAARAWEIGRVSPQDITTPYDYGILLGGYTQMTANTPPGQVSFFRSDRLIGTLQLYHQGKIKKILLSGGSGSLLAKETPEAQLVRNYLLQLHIPDSVILVEDRSRNTRENALYSKALLDSLAGNPRCLLITSAWHLPRARRCFQLAGLPCDIYGTDFFSEQDNGNFFHFLEPDWKCLMKWDALIKEWIGVFSMVNG
jgi:uncharacterized SAM-binding protein YcdF (DUF218 family)